MTTDSSLRTRLRSALLQARRDRDSAAVSAVRGVLAALENAEAVPIDSMPPAGALEDSAAGVGQSDVARRVLSDVDEQVILDAEVASLQEAVTAYESVAPERAQAARAGIELLTALR